MENPPHKQPSRSAGLRHIGSIVRPIVNDVTATRNGTRKENPGTEAWCPFCSPGIPIPEDIARAARAVGLATDLVPARGQAGHLGGGDLALSLSNCLRHNLDLDQLMIGASAFLFALPAHAVENLIAAVHSDLTAGEPIPPLFNYADEAQTWACFASPAEKRTYMAAIWNATPQEERDSFIKTVRSRRRSVA